MKRIYLDYAAATPLDQTVKAAMEPYLSDIFYNPSAAYLGAKDVRQRVETARSRVAQILGVKSAEVIFTAGGTEANNLAIASILGQRSGKKALISSIEHASVMKPATNHDYKLIPCDKNGIVDVAKLTDLIDDSTVLVSVMYANNEIGTIQPLRKIAQIVKLARDKRQKSGKRTPIFFHTDACQAANYLDLHVSRLGVDLMTLNGGKIYGPKQTGCLYVRSGITLKPIIFGGAQEQGLRSGTENVAGIIGFAAALEIAQTTRRSESLRLSSLRDELAKKLMNKFPGVQLRGDKKNRLPNNLSLTFPGVDSERLLMSLDEEGVMVAAGAACSAATDKSSHVLRAIGLGNDEAASTLRVTLGRSTNANDVSEAVKRIEKVLTCLEFGGHKR